MGIIHILLLIEICISQKYVSLDIFYSSECNEDFVSHVLLNITSGCSNYPFYGIYNGFEYNKEAGQIVWTVYENEKCSVEEKNSTTTFNLLECKQSPSIPEFYYLFNVTSVFPADTSTKSGWFVGEYFTDVDCEAPVSRLGFFMYDRYWGADSRLEGDFYFSVDYCTDNYVVLPSFSNSGDFQMFPRSHVEQCQRHFGFSFSNSFKFECLTQEQVEKKYLSVIPPKSDSRYQIRNKSYDSNCTAFSSIQPVALDYCSMENTKYISTDSQVATITYDPSVAECGGDVVSFSISPSLNSSDVSLYGNCEFFEDEERSGEVQEIFGSYELVDDPYFPTLMAGFYTLEAECGDDILPILKNPASLAMLYYFNGDECVNSDLFSYGEFTENLRGSFRGYCDHGKLTIVSYPESQSCLGFYEKYEFSGIGEGFCTPFENRFSFHLTCIPRFCGTFSEDDVENVCNGRGTCIKTDLCECDTGYEGDLCQTFSCFMIDHSETEKVCSGHGTCSGPDKCVCGDGYYGEECNFSSLGSFFLIFGSIMGGMFVIFVSVILIFLLLCVVFGAVCFCVLMCCSCMVFGVLFVTFLQDRKLAKFQKLDDFEILLQEQLIEKNSSIAHIKIDRSAFEVPYDEVKIKKIIGEGGSGSRVYRANWKGRVVAFKCFRTRDLANQDLFQGFETEVNLLVALNHPNVIRFFGATLKPPRVGILMEYCEHGEILKFLRNYRKLHGEAYPIKEKLRMIFEIASSMEYLHSRKIIHRDLKSENVLIDTSETCKLTDFGLSRTLESRFGALKTKRIGTKFYMAPEVISGKYDEKADSFSFSILLWVIITERGNPYGGVSYKLDTLNSLEFRVAIDPEFRPCLEEYDTCFQEQNVQQEASVVRRVEGFLGDSSEVNIEEEKTKKKGLDEYKWIREVMVTCWSHSPDERFSFTELVSIFKKEKVSDRLKLMEKRRRRNKITDDGKYEESSEEEGEGTVNIFDSLPTADEGMMMTMAVEDDDLL